MVFAEGTTTAAEIAEGGVPRAGVVKAFDQREDGGAEVAAGGPGVSVEQFGLQGSSECLPRWSAG